MTEDHEHAHYHGVDKAQEHVGVDQVLKTLLESIKPTKFETVGVLGTNGRVLAKDVNSPVDVPTMGRSTRDGYAVNIQADVESGTSFKVVGEVRIGTKPHLSIKPGEAARVATGSYLPDGTNAVVMVEYTQVSDGNITTNRRVTINENILARGEDISKGQNLLPRGTRIFPQHVALFSMLGIRTISAYRKPKVAFFSTGDELIDLAKKSAKKSTGIFDANRPFIKNMILNLGGIPVDLGIARDRFDAIRNKMKTGLGYDALILSAGSSVGERDYVSKAALSIPGVEMLVHGVAMRPSSPTGIATYRGKPLLLLPGFPTSAIVSFLVFAVPTILGLSGSRVTKLPTLSAKLTEDYTGRQGITHFVRVKVTSVGGTYEAAIVRPTDAQYSGWLRSANGVAIIGETGVVRKDDNVDVFLIGDLAQPT